MNAEPEILLHSCCAPCFTVVNRYFRESGYRVTAFFHNSNIHPWKEWKRRLDAMKDYAGLVQVPLVATEDYPLEENVSMLLNASNRCSACFTERLKATASMAAEMGIGAFSTTLTVSPYQDQEMILKAGMAASEAFGIEFIFKDLRDSYRESIEMSRKAGLYRQAYCGCVFSERDRYLKIRSPGQI